MNFKALKEKMNGRKPQRLEPIFDMARVGFMDDGITYEVYVRTDDGGNIPHVHIWDKGIHGKKFETCVQLKTNTYFLHNGYTDTFNISQKKAFAQFMKSKPQNKRYATYYEFAVDMWNANNSVENVEFKYDDKGDVIIPDYTQLS